MCVCCLIAPLRQQTLLKPIADMLAIASNAFNEDAGEDNIDMWIYAGKTSDLAFGLEHAKLSMSVQRSPEVSSKPYRMSAEFLNRGFCTEMAHFLFSRLIRENGSIL